MNKNDALIAVMRMIDEYEEFGYVHSKLSSLHDLNNFISSLGENVDPETGLARCGCGGKAGFHYSVMIRDNDCCVACGVCGEHSKIALSEEEARDAWNTAMGYKEGVHE